MSSRAFQWIDTDTALRPWKVRSDQFHQMANPAFVFDAAQQAGQVLKTSMQDIIYSQPSLDPFADVAERIRVWGEINENVWVGVHPQDEILPRAWQMDGVFPVLHTALDLERQAHQVEEVFETNLISKAF